MGSDDLDIFSMDFKSEMKSDKKPPKVRKNSIRSDQLEGNLFKIQEKAKSPENKKRKNYKKMSTLPDNMDNTISSGTYPQKKGEHDEQTSEFSPPASKKSYSTEKKAPNIFRATKSKPSNNNKIDSSSGTSHLIPSN